MSRFILLLNQLIKLTLLNMSNKNLDALKKFGRLIIVVLTFHGRKTLYICRRDSKAGGPFYLGPPYLNMSNPKN
jgi:hypothetical protein